MAKTINPLAPLVRRYLETDSEAVARMLETMPEQDIVNALRELPPTVAAKAFPHLQIGYAGALLARDADRMFEAVAKQLPPDRTALLFARLPEDARMRILPRLSDDLKAHLRDFLTYPEGSVGQVMVPSYVAFRKGLTVRDTVTRLRKQAKEYRKHSYAYVVDDDDRLVGVLSTYDLLLATANTPIESLMRTDVFTVDAFADQNAVADELAKRRYFAAPVVDAQGHLLGVIKAELLLSGIKSDVVAGLQKMVGVGAEERTFSTVGFSLRKRLPWLHVNLATAFGAAAVVALFEGTIAQVTALAIFLPVVAGQGGNAGAQSLAIVMRGLVMREIPRDRIRPLLVKETCVGAINGLVIGVVTAGVAYVWMGNVALGVVIGLGMIVNLTAAGLAGASIPLLLKRLGLDPAQSSSIVLTTVTDIVGFLAFLGFAVLFLQYLT